jgi:hypothetical protein
MPHAAATLSPYSVAVMIVLLIAAPLDGPRESA